MCLLVVASRVVDGEPLIVGANRDEVLERPSTAVMVLDEGPPRIVGGRDEISGGTWLAVTSTASAPGSPTSPSGCQGSVQALAGRAAPGAGPPYHRVRRRHALLSAFHPADYNGSWLLVGDKDSLFFVDFTGSGDGTATALPPGIHVLENRALGEPSPKVDLVRAALESRRGDEVARRLSPRPGRPSEPRGRGAAERSQLRAPRDVRDTFVVPGPGASGGGAPRIWVADGAPCTTAYEDVSDAVGPSSPSRPASVAHERLVTQSVGLVGVDTETLVTIRLVVAEVPLPPAGLGLPLEGEHVGGDAVEEPPVVADDHGATGERQECVLEGPQRVDVEVVGRLVEQEDVAAAASTLARSTRLRSPPESWPTFFCWSLPLKPNPAT